MSRRGYRSRREAKRHTTRRTVISELLRNLGDTPPLEEEAIDVTPLEIEITDTVIELEGPAMVVGTV